MRFGGEVWGRVGEGGRRRGHQGSGGGWYQVIYAVQIDLNTIGNICEF